MRGVGFFVLAERVELGREIFEALLLGGGDAVDALDEELGGIFESELNFFAEAATLVGSFGTRAGDFFTDAAFKALLELFYGFKTKEERGEVDIGFAPEEHDKED